MRLSSSMHYHIPWTSIWNGGFMVHKQLSSSSDRSSAKLFLQCLGENLDWLRP